METTTTDTPEIITVGSLLKKLETPKNWVEFKEGIFFQLSYVPKARFREMADANTEYQYNPKTKAREAKLNARKFYTEFVKVAVSGWRGVTPRRLSKIANIQIDDLSEGQQDAELVFSPADLLDLIEVAYELDTFIQEAAMDLKTFRPYFEDELKN